MYKKGRIFTQHDPWRATSGAKIRKDNIFWGKKRKKNNKIEAWQSFQYESVEKLRMFSKIFEIKDKNLNK